MSWHCIKRTQKVVATVGFFDILHCIYHQFTTLENQRGSLEYKGPHAHPWSLCLNILHEAEYQTFIPTSCINRNAY